MMPWGRIHRECFTGSMAGSGADVFAVWSYILIHAWDGEVTVNPAPVAALIGMTEERVREVLAHLSLPDPNSQTTDFEGRRILHRGGIRYHVPSWFYYNSKAEEAEKTEAARLRKEKSRKAKLDRQQLDETTLLGHTPTVTCHKQSVTCHNMSQNNVTRHGMSHQEEITSTETIQDDTKSHEMTSNQVISEGSHQSSGRSSPNVSPIEPIDDEIREKDPESIGW